MSNRNRQDASRSESAPRGLAGWFALSPTYLEQSRRPLVSLCFIVPMLAIYEGGIVYLGPAALRNGADIWLRHLLGQIGLGQYFLLPAITIGLLLAWHHMTHEKWRMSQQIVVAMYLESAVLAFGLLGIGYLERNLSQLAVAALRGDELPIEQGRDHTRYPAPAPASWQRGSSGRQLPSLAVAPNGAVLAMAQPTTTARLIGFCGAGIYEETLFRLLMLPPVTWLLGMFPLTRPWRVGLAIVLTSAFFSAAHYAGPQGEALEWFSVSFRCLAGAFFATLFVYRGFGIAAGTHALYDVLVGLA